MAKRQRLGPPLGKDLDRPIRLLDDGEIRPSSRFCDRPTGITASVSSTYH